MKLLCKLLGHSWKFVGWSVKFFGKTEWRYPDLRKCVRCGYHETVDAPKWEKDLEAKLFAESMK